MVLTKGSLGTPHSIVSFTAPCQVASSLQVIELGRKLGQGQGQGQSSRRASHTGGEGRAPLRQGSFMTSLRRQSSSGSGAKLGLRRQPSSLQLSRYAPMQLDQILTGAVVA